MSFPHCPSQTENFRVAVSGKIYQIHFMIDIIEIDGLGLSR